MATRKQTAIALAESLGATLEGPHYYDDDAEGYWTVDFWAPTGQRWVANKAHATWDREFRLTECWRTAIATMREGLEPCDCGDCALLVEPEATPEAEPTDSGLESVGCSWCEKDATHETTGAGPDPVASCDDCCGECLEVGCGARVESAPEPAAEPTARPEMWLVTYGNDDYALEVYPDGKRRLWSAGALSVLSPMLESDDALRRWNGGATYRVVVKP